MLIVRDRGSFIEGPFEATGPLAGNDYPAEIVNAEYDPRTHYRRGPEVSIVDGVGRVEYTLVPKPDWRVLEERKRRLKTAVEMHGDSLRRSGFGWDFGTEGAPDVQVLQLRRPGVPTPTNDDEKNWSASLGAYTAAAVAGQGAVAGAMFRTASNAVYLRTYSEGVTILTSMFNWIADLVQVVWTKKDAVTAAETHADLDVIEADIASGWPG